MNRLKSDIQANTGFILILLPVLTIIIGTVISKNIDGWGSIASFYIFLFLSGVLCLVPACFGILALKNSTREKGKALLSIFIPLIALFIYYVTFGGNI